MDLLTIEESILQVEALRKTCGDLNGKPVLELGTGWHPFIPILFSLCGCASIHMVDEQWLMDASTFHNSLRNLTRFRDQISRRLGSDTETHTRALRVDSELDLNALFARFRMKYLTPADALHLNLPHDSLDILTSRAVLEHILLAILQSILGEFRRIIAPGGSMCHIIDNSDHWEHGDKSISRVYSLKFEVLAWKLILLNRLDYQNRIPLLWPY